MKKRSPHLTLFLVVLLFSLLIVSYAQEVSPAGTEGGYFGKVIDPDKYILGPGDRIRVFIIMENNQSETLDLTVSSTGNVLLPLAGSLKILNMSLTEASREIVKQLARFYPKSNIQVDLISPRKMKIMITGEVASPGTYLISAVSTLDEAIKVAEGLKTSASTRKIQVKRKDKNIEVDYLRFLKYGDMEQNPYLEEGDAIYVPLMGKSVKVLGQVKNPGMYEIKEGERLKDLIDMAGGLTSRASLYGAILDRVDGKRIELNLYNLIYGKEKEKEEANILLQAGDTITVLTEIKRIQVLGFVRNPGPIQIVEEPKITAEGTEVLGESIMGAKISELIRKAGGVLPNGSTRSIEVRRGGNPENKVVVDLYRVLVLGEESEQDINVFPGDVIYVPPILKSVKITGQVKNPGMYEIKEGEKLKDLVDMAGGLTSRASLYGAILDRVDGKRIELNLYNLIYGKENEKEVANILLQAGDTITVLTEIKRVQVLGFVRNPGPIQIVEEPKITAEGVEVLGESIMGAKISELIRKAGGVLPNGSTRSIEVRRGGSLENKVLVDLYRVLVLGEESEENINVFPGDVIYVPPILKSVKITGQVKNPGMYEIKEGEKLKDLVDIAGGVTAFADLLGCTLERRISEKREIYNIDLGKLIYDNDESVNIPLINGDTLNIPTKADKIYVSGYVVKPQVFTIVKGNDLTGNDTQKMAENEIKEGIKISELISRVGGILPQGSQRRIKVIRDEKVIKEVDLFNVLTKGQIEEENIQLLPGDIVYVPLAERVVKILGEVKDPGTYEVKPGEKIKDLIELAGGFTVRADLSSVVLERFITEKKQTFKLDLTKLYKNRDESVNIELEDGDIVNIPIRIE